MRWEAVSPVNVFLGLSDGLDGTLDFTQIYSFLSEAAVVFALVPWMKDHDEFLECY